MVLPNLPGNLHQPLAAPLHLLLGQLSLMQAEANLTQQQLLGLGQDEQEWSVQAAMKQEVPPLGLHHAFAPAELMDCWTVDLCQALHSPLCLR